ncbi:MAG: hypothetical protein EZS28_014401, partial [Streblomastix strix]
HREEFHSEQIITGKERTANNYTRGHYTTCIQEIYLYIDRIRSLTCNCTDLQCLIDFISFGGGIGAEFWSDRLER